ncbi:MAG: S26 family signal peptidase [Candidatus Levybacteria bacterium]|nr:S26 family signal peptidase [Candidatus Levybacteria bacterium]
MGDKVLVSSIPFLIFKPKVGDIIALKKNKKILIKRILQANPSAGTESYFVRGDNDKDSLEIGWVSKKEIVGKVIFKI